MISVSIVSHGHGAMVDALVAQLLDLPSVCQIIVTLNLPERLCLANDPRVLVLHNRHPKGFGANHNAAFQVHRGDYFCPLNPDIKLVDDPFSVLLPLFHDKRVALVAPKVINPRGEDEDSWRRFPTISSLALKALGLGDGRCVAPNADQPFSPEWVAGMFMLFRSDAFRHLKGFDEKYFLYYEDVDICVRLWRSDFRLLASPSVRVIHDARRDSHRKLGHLRWHLFSMTRYFIRYAFRLPRYSDSPR